MMRKPGPGAGGCNWIDFSAAAKVSPVAPFAGKSEENLTHSFDGSDFKKEDFILK
ncbi:hypothetical protein B4099_2124 [Heyndrickxia coagulans]|uniref:Uncharacterized protein n=1 Tax=Heyndrickxia coagulans TaxID=1398 RepID=A0A150KDI6_HEYCO|nr:hypothetical protein B4099_2124 [Heyndrickxia coagulans]